MPVQHTEDCVGPKARVMCYLLKVVRFLPVPSFDRLHLTSLSFAAWALLYYWAGFYVHSFALF